MQTVRNELQDYPNNYDTRRLETEATEAGIPQYRCRQEPRALVSFCITCKGRLIHLRETLPRNLAWHEDDPDVEFVILNYNSDDNVGEWIKDAYGAEIESGRVLHFFNPEPALFGNPPGIEGVQK